MAEKGRSDGNTSLDGESVADYAKREMAEQEEREHKKKVYWENQAKVATELPKRFFDVAKKIRAEVDTFNNIVDPTRRVSMTESVGLAAHAEAGHAELGLTIGRKNVEAWIGLAELMRLGRAPTAYIIEAQLKLSKARVRIRAEAIPSNTEGIRYRVTVDGKEAKFGFEELASKFVLAVVKDDPAQLGAESGPV